MLLPRIGDEYVDPPEFLHHPRHGAMAEVPVAQVARDGQRPPPFRPDDVRGLFRIVLFAQVAYRDVGPFAGTERHHRPPDPAVGAGDDGHLDRKSTRTNSSPYCAARMPSSA